jgi:CRP-like cAMP-binding protein
VAAVFFLDALSSAAREALFEATRETRFDAGSIVFHHGEPGDSFALLIEGRVKVLTRASNGRTILVGLRGAGELVGEVAILEQQPRGADVVAVDPVLARIGTADAFRRCVLERTDAMAALSSTLAERLRESDRGRIEAAALDVNRRVAVRLVDLAERYGQPGEDGLRIDLPLTQDELADWIAVSRPAAARALAELRNAGLVTTGRRAISVTDAAGLRAYAGAEM